MAADHDPRSPPPTPVRTISRLAVRVAPQGESGVAGDGDQLRFDDLRFKVRRGLFGMMDEG